MLLTTTPPLPSAPSLSWSAALRLTGVELTLPDDLAILDLVDRGMCGGVSFVGLPYAR